MPVSQISPSSLSTTNPYVNPSAKTTEPQSGAIQQGTQDAQKPSKAAQTDTVTISQQALQMTSGNNTATGDTKNSASGNGTNNNPGTTGSSQGNSFSIRG